MTPPVDFCVWLKAELAARRWSYQDLANHAGLSKGAVGVVMSQRQNPGLEFCRGVGRALGYPPENVLRRAGLLPPGPDAPTAPEYQVLWEQLPLETQEALVCVMRALVKT